MTWPPTLTTGPPPVPASMTASVWSVSLSRTVRSATDGFDIEAGRCSALTMPRVTALPSTGPATATKTWPATTADVSPNASVGRPLTWSIFTTATAVSQS